MCFSDASVFTVPMFSLVSGDPAGSLTDDITCAFALAPPCTVFDIETTYYLPAGDIVNHGRWTGVPDLAHPGFVLAGTRPDHDTIVSGTGAYTGAGGRVNGWGVVDAHALPAQLGYDMFTVIRLAPGGDRVLGTGDRLSAASPPDRIAQYCTSDGENTSSEPTHFVAQEVQSEVSLVPDPQRPGFGLVGARPGHDTITAASGVFAGRTGHVDISGSVDLRRFPAAAPFEGVSLVSLGP